MKKLLVMLTEELKGEETVITPCAYASLVKANQRNRIFLFE